MRLERNLQGVDTEVFTVERSFQPVRAVARVLFWLGGVLTGVALVQGAVAPLAAAFFGSLAALHVLRGYDATPDAFAAESSAPAGERCVPLLS